MNKKSQEKEQIKNYLTSARNFSGNDNLPNRGQSLFHEAKMRSAKRDANNRKAPSNTHT